MDSFAAGCIPVYWGSPEVTKDFRPSTFIDVSNFASISSLIDYMEKVYKDENLRESFFKEPILSDEWLNPDGSDKGDEFAKSIADSITSLVGT